MVFFFGRIIKNGVTNFRILVENLAMLYGFITRTRDKNPFEKVPFLWFPSTQLGAGCFFGQSKK
jgi:hypothetical protein